MNIDKLIAEIIPKNDYRHRNGFNNSKIIDSLNNLEKQLVEEALIKKMAETKDMLAVETLAYMKSQKSLPALHTLIGECLDEMKKIIIATSIYEINKDEEMVDIAIGSFHNLNNSYQIISAFYYLVKFKNPMADSLVKEYLNSSDYLLSYNAKRALEIECI